MRHVSFLLFSLIVAASLRGDTEGPVLQIAWVAPAGDVAPGARVEVTRCVLNPTAFETRIVIAETVSATLQGSGKTWPVDLALASGPSSVVLPGSYQMQSYAFKVPSDASGVLVLLVGEGGQRLGFRVSERQTVAAGGAATPPAEPAMAPVAPADAALGAYQKAFTDRFSTHNPIYFVFGPDKPAAKFQFSFKYRLLDTNSGLASSIPALHALHFGYTQRSIWDITSQSSPFYDTSYMPELMFEWLTPREKPKLFQWLGVQTGVQHESNGRDGTFSRSMNIAYVRPMVSLGRAGDWAVLFAPKVLLDLDTLSDNRDLRRYRGNVEYTLMLTKNDNLSVRATARAGNRWDKFSVQVDVNYPLRVRYGNFATFLLLQYWDGYGESLLSYDKKSQTIRAGFGLVR
ncbi:phospholipase A [Nibricoccus sp. IMCC34717]|uniref:phospholipase A n=1 Tax=Nibricoccus sp. IMCC34717 TaxID=3034021 RepID=UPI00384D8777